MTFPPQRGPAYLVHIEVGSEAALVITSKLVDAVQKLRETYNGALLLSSGLALSA